MGRALFSKTYSTPAVRTEPETIVDPVCQKWSVWNKFDPDSDEFFVDAEYEAFVDPAQLHQHIDSTDALTVVSDSDNGTISSLSSESTESTDSDAGSPMATGPDDPVELIASTVGQWAERLETRTDTPPAPVTTTTSGTTTDTANDEESTYQANLRELEERFGVRVGSYRSLAGSTGPPALVLAPGLLTQTRNTGIQANPSPPAATGDASTTTAPSAPTATAALPSYQNQNQTPTTPQRRSSAQGQGSTQTLASPSPPPAVTPRFYSWQNHPIPAMPTSPIAARTNRDTVTLLTNPHARRSFARIGGPLLGAHLLS